MLEERRVRELLDPLQHHLLQQQHQLHREQRERERERERDHQHDRGHHRDRDHRDRERHHHQHLREQQQQQSLHHHHQQLQQLEQQLLQSQHHLQQQMQQHQQQQQREREREREREQREHHRERDRERHQQDYRHHHSQQSQDHHLKGLERERERERERDRSAHALVQGQEESRKQFDCAGALPKGWVREEIVRKTGLSAGKIDVCYNSPNGKKFWSKPQLSRYLGDSVDLSTFDFRTGKVNNLLLRKNRKHRPQQDYSRGARNDTTLLPPIRQTASIFKQPVTVHKTQKASMVKVDFKHGHQEKPKQLFWEKRLEGLRSCDSSGVPLDSLDLPKGVEPVGPNIRPDTVLQSVATALHCNGLPITGQTMPRPNLETNPGVYINPEQPLIQALNVRDDDISRQEEKVFAARKKLEEALKAYDIS